MTIGMKTSLCEVFLAAGPTWAKVFSHDTSGGLFSNIEDAKNINSDDPNAALFSKLDQLEGMRASDGQFHLKLCYPELTQFSPPCNEWTQTSNPATESTITGYQGGQVSFTKNGGGAPFGGLALSNITSSTRIDANPSDELWWYAIGAFSYHGGPDTIPGPQSSDDHHSVKIVEIFVKIEGMN